MFERSILRYQLDHERIYFVQIGAYNGVTSDPFCRFIVEGNWSGILVEPQRRYFEVLREIYRDRPDIICRNVAIGPEDGQVKLYRIRDAEGLPYWAPQVTTMNYEVIASHRDRIPDIENLIVAEDVPCLSLATLIQESHLSRLDLLATDVEGSDFEVIRQIDHLELTPRFIYYEHLHLSSDDRAACERFLVQRGYRVQPVNSGDTCAELVQ